MSEWRPTIAEAIDAYLDDLVIAGRATTTRRRCASALRPLRTPEPIAAFGAPRARGLVAEYVRGHQLSSAFTYYCTLSGWLRWCVARGWLAVSPLRDVAVPKPPQKADAYLTQPQVRALWAAAGSDDTRLCLLLLLVGLRASELCALRWQDVRWDAAELFVAFGKGGTQRTLALDAQTLAALRERGPGPGRIFGFGYRALCKRMHRLGVRAGVPLHAHLLRHTFATQWLLEGGDAFSLQTAGGWKSDSMIRKVYAPSALRAAAIAKQRQLGLTARLLGEEPR